MGDNLIDQMVQYCDRMYSKCECAVCTGKNCKHDCKECLDDIHFHRNNIRTEYDCPRLLYYYMCRYSYKYCSEIIHALQLVDLSRYPYYNILSLGCGGAPDLMAFDHMMDDTSKIQYHGFDLNTHWNNIHTKITELMPQATFSTGFDVKRDMKQLKAHSYNVVIIGYLVSIIYSQKIGIDSVIGFYKNLIRNVIDNKKDDSPMLIIISDVNSQNTGRDTADFLIHWLQNRGYDLPHPPYKRYFSEAFYYQEQGAFQHKDIRNYFQSSTEFQQKYCVALRCEAAQVIIEVE